MPDKMNSNPLRVIFYGTPDFAQTALHALLSDSRYSVALVITQPDRPAGRGAKLRSSPVKNLALEYNIPVLQPERIKSDIDGFLEQCEHYEPFDIGVVCAFGQILPSRVLHAPKCGCVNIHASLLPRWRGAAPIHRAIIEGDQKTGVCLMQMEAGLDTGAVFCESECKIYDATTAGVLHDKLAAMGATLLVENLIRIADGDIAATPQSEELVTYASKISNQEAHIDWHHPAERVLRQIHGMSPFPGAFSVWQGKRLKIFQVQSNEQRLAAGHLRATPQNTLLVGTDSSALQILDLQAEGKRRMSAEEFLRGRKLEESRLE